MAYAVAAYLHFVAIFLLFSLLVLEHLQQTGFDALAHCPVGRAADRVRSLVAEQSLAERHLRARARRVGERRVVDAGLERPVELEKGLLFAVLFTEGHGAQADQADINAAMAKFAIFHKLLIY